MSQGRDSPSGSLSTGWECKIHSCHKARPPKDQGNFDSLNRKHATILEGIPVCHCLGASLWLDLVNRIWRFKASTCCGCSRVSSDHLPLGRLSIHSRLDLSSISAGYLTSSICQQLAATGNRDWRKLFRFLSHFSCIYYHCKVGSWGGFSVADGCWRFSSSSRTPARELCLRSFWQLSFL